MGVSANKTPYHEFYPGSALAAESLDWEFMSSADVTVEDSDGDTLVEGVDYTITGDSRTAAAVLTPLVSVASDVLWKVWSDTAIQQQISLATSKAIDTTQYEKELDRRAMVERELAYELQRAAKVARGATPLAIGTIGAGQMLIRSGDEIVGADNDPAAAEDAALQSANSAAASLSAALLAGSYLTGTEAARNNALTAQSAIEILVGIVGTFPDATAFVPRGLLGATITAPGSGGTNGDYLVGPTGDNFDSDWQLLVTVAGGAITAVQIVNPGYRIAASATVGTADLSGITGLTGATLTLTEGLLVPDTSSWATWDTSAPEDGYAVWQNVGGTPTDTGIAPPTDADVQAILALGQVSATFDFEPGIEINGVSQYGLRFTPGSLAVAGAIEDPALTTYTRASAALEHSGAGTLASYASGDPAYGIDTGGNYTGVALRPGFVNILSSPDNPSTAPWVLDNVTASDVGTSVTGATLKRFTESGSGALVHRIRQSRTGIVTGRYLAAHLVRNDGTVTIIETGLGAPFGNPLIRHNLLSGATAHLGGTDVAKRGMLDLGNNLVMPYVLADADDSLGTTSNLHLWFELGGSITYEAAGRYLDIDCAMFGLGDAPIPFVDGTRAADVLQWSEAGAQRTLAFTVRDPFGEMAENGYFFSWNDGSASNQVALQCAVIDGVNTYSLRNQVGGVNTQVLGPAIADGDQVSLTYDQVTGMGEWYVNADLQTAFALGPTGLDTMCLGCTASGTNQLNAYAERFRVLDGTRDADALVELSGGTVDSGGGGGEAAVIYAYDDVFVTDDGAGGAYIECALGGSSDGLDFQRWHIPFAFASSPHMGPSGSLNLGEGAQGLTDGGVWPVRRTGATSFGAVGQQLLGTGTAMFDSTDISDAPEGGNFFAIPLNSASEHGNCLQVTAQWLLDGRPLTPGGVKFGKNIKLYQTCRWTSFDDGALVGLRHYLYEWTHEGLRVRPVVEWQASETVMAGSYPFMLGAKGVSNYWTDCAREEGGGALDYGTGPAVPYDTVAPWVTVTGPAYYATIEAAVAPGNDPTQGFVHGISEMFTDSKNGNNTGKSYFKPLASNTAVVAGDVWRHEGFIRLGLL